MNYIDPGTAKAMKPGAARCPAISTREIVAGDAEICRRK